MNNFPNLIQSVIYTNKIQIQLSLIAQLKIFQIHVLSVTKSRDIGWVRLTGDKRTTKMSIIEHDLKGKSCIGKP